ncbi:ABC transporter ATP-binding protein [Lactococcus termiticola]|nr:ABC transporter ATP-binding protein [Lactococcus termiticola]
MSMKNFVKLIRMAKTPYTFFILGIIGGVIGTLIQLQVPKMVQPLVNGFSHGVDVAQIILVIGLYILSALMSAGSAIVLGIFGESVVKNLRSKVWDKMIHLPVSYFDETKTGEMSSRLANDTTQVKDLIANSIPSAFTSILLLVGSIIFMISMQWRLTLAMIIAVPVVMLIMFPIMTFGQKIGRTRQDSLANFQGIASESLSEIRLVKSSNAEKQASHKAEKDVNDLYKIGVRESIFDGLMSPVMMLAMMLMIFGLLAYGVYLISTHVMSLGTLLGMMMYLMNLIGAVPTVAQFFTALAKASGSTVRLTELLDEDQEVLHAGKEVDVEGKTLHVNHVDFSYDNSEKILQDITFEAKPNSIVAFAGPSGGGKSTIFALLERFYQPTSGDIKIDAINVNDISLQNWRSQIGFVSQDSAIMAGSIRENLTYGLEGTYSDDDLWHVLELAYARKFVEDMPEGLDTEVGERGVKISGGQRQRIAIARAFLRNPKILMLDEATASLDSESESMVQKALDSLMKGRTTLVIAHRLSTIVDADNIYFIEKGQVTGSGTHNELVASHPLYASYVKEQLTKASV